MSNSNPNSSDTSPQSSQTTVSLHQRRVALGLTRVDLALQARCSINAIALIEQGVTRKGITRDKIIQILTKLEQT